MELLFIHFSATDQARGSMNAMKQKNQLSDVILAQDLIFETK